MVLVGILHDNGFKRGEGDIFGAFVVFVCVGLYRACVVCVVCVCVLCLCCVLEKRASWPSPPGADNVIIWGGGTVRRQAKHTEWIKGLRPGLAGPGLDAKKNTNFCYFLPIHSIHIPFMISSPNFYDCHRLHLQPPQGSKGRGGRARKPFYCKSSSEAARSLDPTNLFLN